jgi:uncharacterized protein (TIGR02270 family)
VYPLLQHADLALRLEAATTIVRMRGAVRQQAFEVLEQVAKTPKHPRAAQALTLSLRARDKDASAYYESQRATLDAPLRHAAAAAVGTVAMVDALVIDCLDPKLSRTAANALALVTGVDLAYADLEGGAPRESAASEPSTPAGDDDDAHNPEDDMTWPEPTRVQAWWMQARQNFAPEQRWLGGQPITPDGQRKVLRSGSQQARSEAAWELALRDHAPLFNTALPARVQRAAS